MQLQLQIIYKPGIIYSVYK